MTLPGARILLLDGQSIRPAAAEETPHWRVMQAVLANPAAFWQAARDGE